MVDPIKKTDKDRRTFWRSLEERDQLSDEARKWIEENAEAAKAWAKWADEHELPLEEYRMF
jgi:post-segregation antitoxin (ccd killing protein)